jgi:hypothetical protein
MKCRAATPRGGARPAARRRRWPRRAAAAGGGAGGGRAAVSGGAQLLGGRHVLAPMRPGACRGAAVAAAGRPPAGAEQQRRRGGCAARPHGARRPRRPGTAPPASRVSHLIEVSIREVARPAAQLAVVLRLQGPPHPAKRRPNRKVRGAIDQWSAPIGGRPALWRLRRRLTGGARGAPGGAVRRCRRPQCERHGLTTVLQAGGAGRKGPAVQSLGGRGRHENGAPGGAAGRGRRGVGKLGRVCWARGRARRRGRVGGVICVCASAPGAASEQCAGGWGRTSQARGRAARRAVGGRARGRGLAGAARAARARAAGRVRGRPGGAVCRGGRARADRGGPRAGAAARRGAPGQRVERGAGFKGGGSTGLGPRPGRRRRRRRRRRPGGGAGA